MSREILNTLTFKDRGFSPQLKVNRQEGNNHLIFSLEVSNAKEMMRQSADTEVRKNTV